MNSAIDNWNYANDARTQGAAKKPVLHFAGCDKCGEPVKYVGPPYKMLATCDCADFEYCEQEIELPTTWGVCPVCRGEGKHVNPSIDAGGISREQFHDDPDFAEQYWNGTYDQTCTRCEGKRVVPVVDRAAMTADQVRLYDEQLDDEAAAHAEHLAEIRAGC